MIASSSLSTASGEGLRLQATGIDLDIALLLRYKKKVLWYVSVQPHNVQKRIHSIYFIKNLLILTHVYKGNCVQHLPFGRRTQELLLRTSWAVALVGGVLTDLKDLVSLSSCGVNYIQLLQVSRKGQGQCGVESSRSSL